MTTPAGWYADPTDPSRTRWWDGAQWTEHTAPLPASAPAAPAAAAPAPAAPAAEPTPAEPAEPAAPPSPAEPAPAAAAPAEPAPAAVEPTSATTPIAPSAPIPPVAPPVPRYGEYAPTATPPASPAQPAYAPAPHQAAAPAYAGYPAAPSWSQQPVAVGPSAPGVPTNTLWIYLSILASTLPILSLFLIDWNGFLRAIATIDTRGGGGSVELMNASMALTGQSLMVSVLSYAAIAASIVFAWLDWRELKKRGVARPFHWGFAFFALLISIGVYIIGRTVVLRRETGSGLTALWVWIGSIGLAIIISIAWYAWFWQQLMTILTTYGV